MSRDDAIKVVSGYISGRTSRAHSGFLVGFWRTGFRFHGNDKEAGMRDCDSGLGAFVSLNMGLDNILIWY